MGAGRRPARDEVAHPPPNPPPQGGRALLGWRGLMATALRSPAPDAATRDVEAYLLANARKSLLRFITCGSVDDGKSTLIGRLLYDSKMLFEDQLAALERDSRRSGAAGGALDF